MPLKGDELYLAALDYFISNDEYTMESTVSEAAELCTTMLLIRRHRRMYLQVPSYYRSVRSEDVRNVWGFLSCFIEDPNWHLSYSKRGHNSILDELDLRWPGPTLGYDVTESFISAMDDSQIFLLERTNKLASSPKIIVKYI